jgi:ATP-dependent 26S proteasome regulatory subunit
MSPAGSVLLGIFLGVLGYIAISHYKGSKGRLNDRLQKFFGKNPLQLHIVSRRFATIDLPNLQMAILRVIEEDNASADSVGYATSFGGFNNDLRSLIGGTSMFDRTKVGPVQLREVDIDVDRTMSCIENGIHLIRGANRIAAHVRSDMMSGALDLEVMVENPAVGENFVERVRSAISRNNIYKGKVISLETGESINRTGRSCATVRFHRAPQIERDQIILPAKILKLIERNTLGFYKHAEVLRQSGRSTKRGLLLYGKPGTGKTFTAKWLAHAQPDLTVILMSGEQLGLIKEGCQLARMLAPSLVIMEDVDLVATHRDENRDPSSHVTLHQILNEMDGMPENTDVMFLLTTNRPDVLEPALAGRPGRIDQAVEFPLPDTECRRRLFALYSQGLNMGDLDLEPFVARTDGASPAFIQELMRKSVLIAAERAPTGGAVTVTGEDIDTAIRELLFDGGDLTRNLLGFSAESPAQSF